MNDELELVNDRIEDLERHLVELENSIKTPKKVAKESTTFAFYIFIVTLPLTVVMLILMGLSINYQSDNHQISYNNDSLIELGLSGLTLLSGVYSLKKHREQETL